MSPLWRDELTIGFAPGRLELVRRGRGWRPAVEHAAVITIEQERDAGWQGGVAALAEALADPRWQGAQCRLVLSNHHVRFALIDAPPELANDEERDAYVGLRYRAIYGDRAALWQYTFAPFGPGARSVACAIDRALLQALLECTAGARLALLSMQPHLVAALNRVAADIRGDNAWFVTVEHGRIGMAAFASDQWAGVRNEPLRGDLGEAVAAMLNQDALGRELVEGDCHAYVHAPGWRGDLIAPGPGWQLHRVLRPSAEAIGRQSAVHFDAADFPLTLPAGACA